VGIKAHKVTRVRDLYDASVYDQDAGNPEPDAPTHCMFCRDALTTLRRESGKPWCTREDCLLSGRLERTRNWRLIDMPKQGVTVVISDGSPIISHKRGPI
jgi:hypothetical protein